MGIKETARRVLPAPVFGVLKRANRRARLEAERMSSRQRRVNAAIVVPGLPRSRRQAGSVWGVCMARNEADIIGHSVRHLLEQGVAGVIVVDNLSTDDTRAVLDDLAAADPRVHVGTDSEVKYDQDLKTSFLAHLAWRAGADWVIPFDADEFWYAADATLSEFLAGQSADELWCDYRNVYPMEEDGALRLGSGRAVQVDRLASSWMRVAFRARSWVWVGFGNHALRDRDRVPALGLHMLHFSYRSLAQYSRKADVGVAALEAAGRDSSIATHWRAWAALSDDERAARWSAYLRGDAGDMTDAFVRADRRVIADPTGWRTWDPEHLLRDGA